MRITSLYSVPVVVLLACGPSGSGQNDPDAATPPAIDATPLADVPVYPDAEPPPMQPVHVIITADNAYGFGYGEETGMSNYFGGIENNTAGEIFNCPIGNGPEEYTVPADDASAGNFLYIVAYADAATTQGVLGQFFREGGEPVYTGLGEWTVCATGQNFNPGSGGPSLEQINAQIVICNDGTGDPATTSAGWVDTVGTQNGKLEFGEDNTTARASVTPGNEFPIVCSIDDAARWMWFNWDPAAIQWPNNGSPFIWPGGGGNADKQFLLFRIAAEDIPYVE